MTFPTLSPEVEAALHACGRDRVFHNDGTPPMVAIRWDYAADAGQPAVIYGKAEGPAEGHDAAGRRAAQAFAAQLRARGLQLIAWAERIEEALGGEKREAAGGLTRSALASQRDGREALLATERAKADQDVIWIAELVGSINALCWALGEKTRAKVTEEERAAVRRFRAGRRWPVKRMLCWLGHHRWHVGAVYAPPVCRRCLVVCKCYYTFQRCEVHGADRAPLWPALAAPLVLIALAFLFAWAVGK